LRGKGKIRKDGLSTIKGGTKPDSKRGGGGEKTTNTHLVPRFWEVPTKKRERREGGKTRKKIGESKSTWQLKKGGEG